MCSAVHVCFQVSGFHLPRQLTSKASEASKVKSVLSSIGKLVKTGLVTLDFTEYDFKALGAADQGGLEPEWKEAVQHVVEGPSGGSKVLLKLQ